MITRHLSLLAGMTSVWLFSCQPQPTGSSAPAEAPVGRPVSETLTTSTGQAVYEGIEFDMPRVQEPQIPNNTVRITDFGAVGDGLVKNTQAFERAIAAAAAKGGGKVVIPRGMWLTGPIVLKSNINLHAEDGALVVFSQDLENIAITGPGTFDGSGDAWRPVNKEKMTDAQWKKLVNSGGVLSDDKKKWYPTEQLKKGDSTGNFNVPDFKTVAEFEAVKDFLRPVLLSLINCNKVLLDGPTFQNSPAWNLHPLMCQDVTIRNLNVGNPWYSQNGDGLDLESCNNAVIYDITFDVGDDAICFKSGKDQDGRERGIPTENVVVKNCVVYHGHGALW